MARHEDRPALTTAHQAGVGVDAQAAFELLRLGRVTGVAVPRKNGVDPVFKKRHIGLTEWRGPAQRGKRHQSHRRHTCFSDAMPHARRVLKWAKSAAKTQLWGGCECWPLRRDRFRGRQRTLYRNGPET